MCVEFISLFRPSRWYRGFRSVIRELIALPWHITSLYQVNCPVQVISIAPRNIFSLDECLMTAAHQRSRPSKSLTWKIEAAQSGSRPSRIQFDPEMAPMGSLTSFRQVLRVGFWMSGLLRKLPSLSQGRASFNCGKVYMVLKEKVHILTIKVGMMNVYMLCWFLWSFGNQINWTWQGFETDRLQEIVTEWVRDGCGLRKERGKRAEADRERIGRASKRTGSRRTWLQLMRCALVHTGVLFRKSLSDRKGNRGNRSRYSDWRYRRKHLSIYTNYVFHMEQVRRDREWKS